jgi:putative spermidine/putrescine transport system permease protein
VDGNQGLAAVLWRRPRLQLSLLLAGPIGWLVIAYLGSLAVLFVAAFWQLDTFSGEVVHVYGLQNFQTLVENDVYRTIVLRTAAIAAGLIAHDNEMYGTAAVYLRLKGIVPPSTEGRGRRGRG